MPVTWTKRAVPTSIAAIQTVIATYAVLRAYDVLFKSEANPATIIWSARIAMFWRLGIGSYVAGMVAMGVFVAAGSRFAATTRVVAWAVPVVAAMIALQGLFFVTPVAILRIVEHIHGHMGWLSVAALLHPAIVLRNPKRQARLSVTLATLVAVASGGVGAWIYPEYRARLKQAIFIHAPTLGWCFERKEHLAVGAIGFACIGCIAHLSARGVEDEGLREVLAKAAHRAYVASFLLALFVAVLGVVVASYSTF